MIKAFSHSYVFTLILPSNAIQFRWWIIEINYIKWKNNICFILCLCIYVCYAVLNEFVWNEYGQCLDRDCCVIVAFQSFLCCCCNRYLYQRNKQPQYKRYYFHLSSNFISEILDFTSNITCVIFYFYFIYLFWYHNIILTWPPRCLYCRKDAFGSWVILVHFRFLFIFRSILYSLCEGMTSFPLSVRRLLGKCKFLRH